MSRNPYSTPVKTLAPGRPDPAVIAEAAAVLRRGGTVAFPTETVYGLGANALDAAAVERVFTAKGRPSYDPLIVHLAGVADLPRVVRAVPDAAAKLAAAFWPGPLSLVLPRAAAVPDIVTAGRNTVAVRIPAHPVALALIAAAGVPVAAPSANRFGHTSPTTAAHVLDDLDGRIDLVLDGGATAVGVESTVLDLSGDVPALLRPGGVSLEQLQSVIGEIALPGRAALDEHAPAAAPGMLASHYAPRAEVRLFAGPEAGVLREIRRQALEAAAAGRRCGLLVSDEDAERFAELGGHIVVARLGPAARPDLRARRLFAAMRDLDAGGVSVILARLTGDAGLERAIADRLRRAAGGRVVWVEGSSTSVNTL